jgi:uncharacterized protein
MESKKELLLNREYTLKLLKKLGLPLNIRKHCIMVSKKGMKISKKIMKIKINYNFVEIGGLIHDIGRLKTHGLDHGIVGGKIAKELGFPEEIVKICERHVLGGLDKRDIQKFLPEYDIDIDLIPQSIEEKIICLADKCFQGSKEVSIDRRFRSWFKRKDRNYKFLLKSKHRIERIQEEINQLM